MRLASPRCRAPATTSSCSTPRRQPIEPLRTAVRSAWRPPLRRRLRPDAGGRARPARPDTDFLYRIFNADGGEVQQCGNGARCFVRFVHDKGLTDQARNPRRDDVRRHRPAARADGQVTVDMGRPSSSRRASRSRAGGAITTLALDGAGRPCARSAWCRWAIRTRCRWWTTSTRAPVATEGPLIERHPRFPQRVNAGFCR
jgi:diaminopimelate epimerase